MLGKRGFIAMASAVVCGSALVLHAATSFASEPLDETLAAASRAEDRAEPKVALELYHRAAAEHEGERLVRRAKARIDWLEARAEGDHGPLAEWLRVRSQGTATLSEEDLSVFAARVRAFPSGLVRREATQFIADAWLTHFERPSEALDAYERWSREPGIDDAERQLSAAGAALARGRLGNGEEALRELHRSGLDGRAEARFLRAERIGTIGSAVSLACLAAYAVALASLLVRVRRPFRRRDDLLAYGLVGIFTLGLPIVFVHRYDPQLVHAFAPTMGAAALVVTATWLVAQATEPSRLLARRLKWASAAAVVAAVFLATTRSGMLTELLMAAWEPR